MARIVLTETQLLREMVAHELHSRKEVCERLHVSKPSVTRVIERLLRQRLVEEGERYSAQRRGRKTNTLRVRSDLAYFLGTDFDGMAVRACMLDCSLQVVSSGKRLIDLHRPPGELMNQWSVLVEDVIRTANVPAKKIVGCGAGVSIVVAPDSLQTRGYMPPGQWVTMDVGASLNRFGVPIMLANTALCVAEYERRLGAGSKASDFAAVLVRHGIGAVLYHQGAFVINSQALNSKFGHVKVGTDGSKCICGEYGCLDTFCSGRTWPESWERRGPNWEKQLQSRIRYLGIGIAGLLKTVYSPLVIVNGIYNEYESIVLPTLIETVRQSTAAVDLPVPTVIMSSGGEFNTSIGAALLVIDRYFEPYLQTHTLRHAR